MDTLEVVYSACYNSTNIYNNTFINADFVFQGRKYFSLEKPQSILESDFQGMYSESALILPT